MIIDLLENQADFITDVSSMVYKEFVVNTGSKMTFDDVFTYFSNTHSKQFPITLVAIEKTERIGTVSIFENDLKEREIYKPWLASLYTTFEHRGKGVGQRLINETLKVVKELGYKEVYLRTENASNYYQDRGWSFVETILDNKGEKIDVFKFILHNNAALQN
ncbi:GNAT family N-acetyltransferase [Priestia megaterium]|uniref:GNAT family N-acetyltransferase n=1 Tax=Priestia megaterium TaxID=1404 RepID=UPI0004712987|nr:GNAT family N-acetyltransferase [Priestia megaterium]TCN05961.1 acetyltransferase (GNAT) family protein [Bacillus sp. BK006]